MDFDPFRTATDPVLSRGVAAGALAYALGVCILIFIERVGLHPETGVWLWEFALEEYLLAHSGAHLPLWGTTLRTELLGYSLILTAILVLAGFLLTRSIDTENRGPFQTGGTLVAGYFPATLLGSVSIIVTIDSVSAVQWVVPALLVGVVYPVLFGGIGGLLATRVDTRTPEN